MSNEYYKITEIWQRFRKSYRQYPFSICDFVSANPGSTDTLIGSGMVPDGRAIYRTIPPGDEGDIAEIQSNSHIDPPFIYDGSVVTGMKDAI